jgi:VanZ family protein
MALVLACAVLIFGAGLSPARALPPLIRGTGQSDLILHALGFGALALPAALLLGPVRGGAVTAIAVVALEVLQHWAPGREASLSDTTAGLAGALAVLVCLWLFGRATRGRA